MIDKNEIKCTTTCPNCGIIYEYEHIPITNQFFVCECNELWYEEVSEEQKIKDEMEFRMRVRCID